MKPEEVFKRYDVRGSYPEEVDEEFAERLGKALGTFSRRNYLEQVVVAKDTKDSSESLKDAFVRGVLETGVDVLDAGTGPTDYTAFTGGNDSCISVQVTSSHLPLDTNGFKFMYPEGNGFLNEDLYRVQELFRQENFESGDGELVEMENPREAYFKAIDEYFHRHFESIGRKVVVDTLGGANREFLPELLESLGAETVNLASGKEKPYMDPPNPEPHRLEHVEEEVEKRGADLGIVTDMDSDRVAVYCSGDWLTGDEIFAILAGEIEGNVVASIDTSKMVEEVVEENDGEIYYTRVGDPFVIDRTLEETAALAGEPNGHYCFPEFIAYNSGTLSALVLAALNLEKALDRIPDYYTETGKVKVGDKQERMAAVVEHVMENYNLVSDLDGVKFELGDATTLIRPSGSSPYLRIKTDSQSAKEALDALEEARDIIRNP